MNDEFHGVDVDPNPEPEAPAPATDDQPPVVRFLVALARSVVAPDEESTRALSAAAQAVIAEFDQ